MNVLPVDMSNVHVHVPVRAQTMLVNGFPVQSVAHFEYSAQTVEIPDVYLYDDHENYQIAVDDLTVAARRIDQAYSDNTKDMKVHPIMHSNKYSINLFPLV
jgi:hypothetical protein